MFLTHAITAVYKPNEWVLVRQLLWRGNGATVVVPPRFITDLASVPAALRMLPSFNPNGLSREPAILHDYLYCTGLTGSRAAADALFYHALRSVGMSVAAARAHWLGVRAGGWGYWGKRRANENLADEDFLGAAEFELLLAGSPHRT